MGAEMGSWIAVTAAGAAGLLLLIIAFAAYDRREEVGHDVWEERGREFDQPED